MLLTIGTNLDIFAHTKNNIIMNLSNIGLIGLAVMGENLALNMESKGFTVSIYNRIHADREPVVSKFMNARGKGKKFFPAYSVEEFVNSIEKPRKIMMMVKAGNAVDQIIEGLLPFLDKGDVVIDGGNSDFTDTERRVKYLEDKGILFVGAGVSGGEEGALHGPSIMPGGSEKAWEIVREPLQAIAAKADDGSPCCEWMGKGGAGHFVKMIHNGIEYGDMQIIAETYSMLKYNDELSNGEISKTFENWNQGELNSFLVEITSKITSFKENDEYLVDKILDVAGQKGTGKWSVMASLEEGDPLTLVAESVMARFLSSIKSVREQASEIYPQSIEKGDKLGEYSLGKAMYGSKIISYAQGFSLLKKASERYNWNLNLGVIAKIWRKGCIIRSAFLERITEAFEENKNLDNLLFAPYFVDKMNEVLPHWRKTLASSIISGIPMPCNAAALTYFDGLRTKHSSANIIQAQRDFFGAHTYERVDKPRGEYFHTDWTGEGGDTVSGTYNV